MTSLKQHIVRTVCLCLVIATVVPSCKKKEEEQVFYYLNGALRFSSEAFIPQSSEEGYWVADVDETEDCHTFIPSGVSHPLKDGTVGYYFLVTPGMHTSDTTKWLDGRYHFDERGSFRYHFGDSLGTYKVYAYSFGSEKYNGTSYTSYVTVVKPGLDGSVKTVCADGEEIFTDPRDGNQYVVVKVGETSWLKPNLAYAGSEEEPLGLGYCGYDVMSAVFGRYYTWEEAQKACPDGWTLPSDADWAAAASTFASDGAAPGESWKNAAGGFIDRKVIFNNDKEAYFWDYWPKVDATNSTGLTLLSTGYGSKNSKAFEGYRSMAVQWTSDEAQDSAKGVYRYLRDSYPDVYVGQADKTDFVANVRCIKE
ncbi:MAG: hypothetical protein MJY56_05125 [Bacteroidales bacterium]|nr:hypothetical protein [Bacteroidales bacterium]